MSKLVMFHGAECPHCHVMMPLVDKLKEEEGIEFEKLEVWHNEDNANKMRQYQKEIVKACGGPFGTPAFVNTETHEALCGEQQYDKLKEWAKK